MKTRLYENVGVQMARERNAAFLARAGELAVAAGLPPLPGQTGRLPLPRGWRKTVEVASRLHGQMRLGVWDERGAWVGISHCAADPQTGQWEEEALLLSAACRDAARAALMVGGEFQPGRRAGE